MAIGLLVLLVLMVSKVDADDVSYLQKETTALKLKIDLLSKRVFFKATFQDPIASCKGDQAVIFDSAQTNVGNAYSSTSGVFTAPFRGDYVFAYQTFSYGGADISWDLYINDQMALRARSRTSDDTSNESVLPVTLQAGDRVYVKSHLDLTFYGRNHSFFAGWLVTAF
ncbi:complement C1q-like protein 4 [Pomacea canaliculata]|nr:complement C1q-like protein 4 [Pomacea canaliculata]